MTAPGRSQSTLAVDVAAGLVASGIWAVTVSHGPIGDVLRPHTALWGGAALFATPFVVLARRARPFSHRVVVALQGAALAALPTAIFGVGIISTTHHRALGAVTFAVAAVVLWAFAMAISARLGHPSSDSGKAWLLYVGVATSLGSLMLVLCSGRTLPTGIGPAVTLAVALLAGAVAAPRWRARTWVSAATVILWMSLVSHAVVSKTAHRAVDDRRIGF